MRITVSHETTYTYEVAPASVIELLRLTPRSTANQTVRSWRIDVTGDATLRRAEDAFGNIVHTFYAHDPGERLRVTAVGTVDTEPTSGVAAGAPEPQPLGVWRRQTPLTKADASLVALAGAARASVGEAALDRAHALNRLVHERIAYERGSTTAATPATAALAAGRGVCQDLTHVLIAAARADGLPARYVSGYQYVEGQPRTHHESHAWAEVHVDGLGWVSLDPTFGASATDAYVRVAVGLDTLSASPVRGATYGGAGEALSVAVTVDRAVSQSRQVQDGRSQSQSQSQG
ncbi:transglutaminase family protein [Acuticoccus sp.]|uniref:transglutaminase family protein n=1 Tax=Acuticoccus sp. TaxID=1904378 RepID=UPI003B529100